MLGAAQELFEQEIPGVKRAGQKRSKLLQDNFVKAGRKALLKARLDDLSIPALAEAAGSSVGGFYSRFDSKEAFFEFLRLQMLVEHMALYEQCLAPALFKDKTAYDVTEAFVDVMLRVFNGPWRGVLREAYSVIPERPESWAPMKARGQYLRALILELYCPLVGDPETLGERVSIAVQLLFSALNNEMMNPNLAFSIEDPKFRTYLIAAFNALVTDAAYTPKD